MHYSMVDVSRYSINMVRPFWLLALLPVASVHAPLHSTTRIPILLHQYGLYGTQSTWLASVDRMLSADVSVTELPL
jgi:hypothetical protein